MRWAPGNIDLDLIDNRHLRGLINEGGHLKKMEIGVSTYMCETYESASLQRVCMWGIQFGHAHRLTVMVRTS